MSKFFTATGDDGTTGLLGDERVKKYDPRMETLGALDELSATLGMARSICLKSTSVVVKDIQVDLYKIMAEVAATDEQQARFRQITQLNVEFLENRIQELSNGIADPKGFILPGDTQASASISLARSVARRAERRVAELLDLRVIENDQLVRYLNRLSSLLFVMELKEVAESDAGKLSFAKENNK
jgi:cob(I)alamin adenosyltransferase